MANTENLYFPLRLRIQGTDQAVPLLQSFLARLQSRTEIMSGELISDAEGAQILVRVPWKYKEQARVEWNIFIADTEEQFGKEADRLRMELESCIEEKA